MVILEKGPKSGHNWLACSLVPSPMRVTLPGPCLQLSLPEGSRQSCRARWTRGHKFVVDVGSFERILTGSAGRVSHGQRFKTVPDGSDSAGHAQRSFLTDGTRNDNIGECYSRV